MQIKTEEDVSVLLKLLHHLLVVVNCWLHLTRRIDPAPVKVHSCQVATGVTVDHTVRVKHGHHFEDKVVSQDLSV